MPLPSGGDFKPILEYYRRYLKDPSSVPIDWALYFEEKQKSNELQKKNEDLRPTFDNQIDNITNMYRQYGHLSAKTDPLNRKNISEHLDIKKAVSRIFSDLSSEKENNKKIKNCTSPTEQIGGKIISQ